MQAHRFISNIWKPTLLVIIGLLLFNPLQGRGLLNNKAKIAEKYLQGPQKDWSEREIEKYYDWRNATLAKQLDVEDDPQLLIRQSAILTGNKITTEIWNFGSISSPGNTNTDIIWENLGYGYEFGPFICAEVEVAYQSHLDAYPKVDKSGDTAFVSMVGTGGLVDPYQFTWKTDWDTVSGRIEIYFDSYSDVGGAGIYNLYAPVSDQEDYAVNLSNIIIGDTLIFQVNSYSASCVVQGMKVEDEYIRYTYDVVAGSMAGIFGNTVTMDIGPIDRAVYMARVVSDGLVSLGGETSPDLTEFWGWQPLAYSDEGIEYADPDYEYIPTSTDVDRDSDGKPDSWADGWYSESQKTYVWPGALQQGSSNSDMESFFVVDDRTNKEFYYYPFPEDSSRRGLGLEIESRYYQWANPLAEDIIFLIYKVTNKSSKDLHDVIFGMWGDPHIGGPSDYNDDLSFFNKELNMVYAWDENGKGEKNLKPGYFGYKFLESPGDPYDGLDNDLDGMTDESQTNNFDDDGDWNPEKDDVGMDGVPNTGDEGEGDGVPTAGDPFDILLPGEPNFEWTDLDESDMIGLTGFTAPPFSSQNRISNDHRVFENFIQPGVFDSGNVNSAGDYVFIYSSGPLELASGETRRFSIALLIGEDYDDLTLNAETAQDIYEKNYQFAKPPEKPTVTAVPGDGKVTLYWDDAAESSYDPISESNDFEGYIIYRSTDPDFLDQQTITDAYGSGFLMEPLKTTTGAAARFDLDNDYVGLASIPFSGRGTFYYLGDNTGLVHSYIDSNNVLNGQTYYYAVVSYDHGDDSLEIAPTECSKTITLNPETNEVTLDINTIEIVPRAASAGYMKGTVVENAIDHIDGVSTGSLKIDVIDPRNVEDGNVFYVYFSTSPSTNYSILDSSIIVDTVYIRLDQYVQLEKSGIVDSSFVLHNLDGSTVYTDSVDYELLAESGLLMAHTSGAIANLGNVVAEYIHYPILNSTLVDMQESNPIFDGMKIYAQDVALELVTEGSGTGWSSTSNTNYQMEVKPFNGIASYKYPADYEIRFFDELVDSSSRAGFGYIKCNFEVWDVTESRIPAKKPIYILEASPKDSVASPGDRIIILETLDPVWYTYEFKMLYPSASDTVEPGEGDLYYVQTTRPFDDDDIYRFETSGATIDAARAENDLDDICVVPNPYVVTNVIEPLDHQNTTDRGPRRLYFNNLPKQCTIKIFTITGELVDVIHHNSSMDSGIEFWDLTTRDNFPIAYGVYIYHVDAGDLGEKIGRFGVIK